MMLFKGSKKGRSDETPGEYEAPVKLAATSWSRGQVLAATVAKVCVWALVLTGPLALLVSLTAMRSATRPAPTAAATQEVHWGEREATIVAQHAVTTWLRADRSLEAEVGMAGLPTGALPSRGLDVSDPAVADASWQDDVWTITVAVTVTTSVPAAREDQPPLVTTQRRYFQVPVTVDVDGAARLLALPAEVAGPAVLPLEPNRQYRTRITTGHPAAQAAEEFIKALLTGTGDITRFTAPGSTIRAIVPAPYTELTVQTVTASEDPQGATSDGQSIDLLVRVTAADVTEAQTQLDYLLSLAPRDGRWEVTAMKSAQKPEETTAQPSSTPSVRTTPTPTPTKK